MKCVCILPRLQGIGGMVTFSEKVERGLSARGIRVTRTTTDVQINAVLVIGGTRHLQNLWYLRKKGIPIIQRLDGLNWLHRIQMKNTPARINVRHILRAEYGNLLLAFIRRFFANKIVYQSRFVQEWWERKHGMISTPDTVIYNGVDLEVYKPANMNQRPSDCFRLLLVEGSMMGGYEQGLTVASKLCLKIEKEYRNLLGKKLELMVVGRVSPRTKRKVEEILTLNSGSSELNLVWKDQQPPEMIPELDNASHLLYSADINAACPNSVVEALACGLPVVSFITGALPELVNGDAGRIVPYGADPWKLESPDIGSLAEASVEIFLDQQRFRSAARRHAEEFFDIDRMLDAYTNVLFDI